jgi:rhamnogalacturonan acetylesterase
MKKIKLTYYLPALLVIVLSIMSFKPKQKPTLYMIGDSTMNNSGKGWGNVAYKVFDTTKIKISNQAAAGRCTRQFLSEGRWDKVLSTIGKGDFLIMAWGHNEGLDTNRNVGVIAGIGDQHFTLTRNGKPVEYRSYGWYLEKFTREAQAKGATVVIASMIPRSDFKLGDDGVDRVIRNDKEYALWSKQIADKTGAFFVDINKISADKFDKLGRAETKKLYPLDHTHTNADGALIHAQSAGEGIRMQKKIKLNKYLIKNFSPAV